MEHAFLKARVQAPPWSPMGFGANCRTEAVDEESLTIDSICHRRTPPPRGKDVASLILLFASPGKSESDEGIANRVITRIPATQAVTDRKSTRLNSSHSQISYAVFCLKKKKINTPHAFTSEFQQVYCRFTIPCSTIPANPSYTYVRGA